MSNSEENILKGDDAYNLYLEGRDEWNKWVSDHSDCEIDFSTQVFRRDTDFSGFRFPGAVNFTKAKFRKGVKFKKAYFGRGLNFREAKFFGYADFSDAKFSRWGASFSGSKFMGMTDFNDAEFFAAADFRETLFCKESYFERTDFSNGGGNFKKAKFIGQANFGGVKFSEQACFRDVEFSTEANFISIKFPKGANFTKTKFLGKADFRETEFSEDPKAKAKAKAGAGAKAGAKAKAEVNFNGAEFFGEANFTGGRFWGLTNFDSAEFLALASFNGAEFLHETSNPSFNMAKFQVIKIDRTEFACAPDLRHTVIENGISMHDIQVSYRTKKESHRLGHALDIEDSERYRRLKDLAITAKDHDREQMFFAYELKAKRYYETTGFKLVPNLLYDWLSGYGRSLTRPVIGLAGVWAIFSAIYDPLLKCTGISPILFSSSQIAPFLGGSSIFSKAFLKAESLGGWILTFAFVENILGVLFLFLIGLALRNRFKL